MITIVKIKEIANEVSKSHPYQVEGKPDTYNDYNQGWQDACDVMETKLLDSAKTDYIITSDHGKSIVSAHTIMEALDLFNEKNPYDIWHTIQIKR